MKSKMVRPWGLLPIATLSLLVSVSTTWGHVPPDVELVPGRMTGGGSIFTGPNDQVYESDGTPLPAGTEVRVTHGFELHCNANIGPNNLEVNVHPDGGGSRFHLEMLVDAACWDDPSIDPTPPAAPFDHYFGFGVGRYNGELGYCAKWVFTDAGERGTDDYIKYLVVWHCSTDRIVVAIGEPGHPLTFGNHQAHKENK